MQNKYIIKMWLVSLNMQENEQLYSQKREGVLYVISSPSGGGKTSIINLIRKQHPNLKVSVSYTSRKMRENEQDGKDYFFVTDKKFKELIKQDFFIEYANVFGNFYGVPCGDISNSIKNGIDHIFSITYHGYTELLKRFPNNVVGIFILPESDEVLKQRLISRNTETEESIKIRLDRIREEIELSQMYDYAVVNDKLDVAADKVSCIITAEQLKCLRLIKG